MFKKTLSIILISLQILSGTSFCLAQPSASITVRVTVTSDDPPPGPDFAISVWPAPAAFSPNNDGIQDSTSICMSAMLPPGPDPENPEPLFFPLIWHIVINNSSGQMVRMLSTLSFDTFAAVQWDGKDETGTIHPGIYTFVVTADYGDQTGGPAQGQVTVDTSLVNVQITWPQDGAIVTIPDITVQYTVNGAPKTRDVSLIEGRNQVVITDTDGAGNSGTASVSVSLDTTPPVIISYWPVTGTTISNRGRPLTFNVNFGDAVSGVNLSKVRLLDADNNDITAAAAVSEHNISYVIEHPLNNTGYSFTVNLEDNAGNAESRKISFTVKNTAPDIAADIGGGRFDAPFTVQLKCTEPADIYYSIDGYPPFAGAANTVHVEGLTAEVPIGTTTKLQFYAEDDAGNQSTLKSEIYLFDELPTPVSGLQGAYLPGQIIIRLDWPSAADVSGYHVYRASNIQEVNLLKDSRSRGYPAPQRLRLTFEPTADNYYEDSDISSGTTYWYAVSLVDGKGIESAVSELISVGVPDMPPVVTREEAAKRAVSWIESNQNADASWGSKTETVMLCTSQVLNALVLSEIDSLNKLWVRRGLFYLRGNYADNNDYLARKIITFAHYTLQHGDEMLNDLISQADIDGTDIFGWGAQKYCSSDAVTTALALKALGMAGSSEWHIYQNVSTAAAYNALTIYPYIYPEYPVDPGDPVAMGNYSGQVFAFSKSLRSKNGHHGWAPREDTSIFVSSLVYSTLPWGRIILPQTDYQWIFTSQKPDGSFGTGLVDTAAVMLWLGEYLDEEPKTRAVNYLISRQNTNGSWNNNDAYVTGLCLEAILSNY